MAQARSAQSGGFPGAGGPSTPWQQSPVLDSWNQQQGISWAAQVYSASAVGLPRSYQDFRSGQFSPMEPIYPVPIDVGEEPSGRPRPRRFQFPVGFNLPVGQPGTEGLKLANFQVLRDYAEVPTIPRDCIEICSNDLINLDYDIIPTPDAQRAQQTNPAARKDFEDRKAEAMEFFSNPDPDQYDSFEEWFTAIAEDSLVLDAIALHLVPSTGKGHGPCGSNVGALAALDGATIKPLLNEWGARLRPPNACFSSDTEILTRRRGWLTFDQVMTSDEVATRDPSGVFEWQRPSRVIGYEYDGDLIWFHGRSVDQLVTPNHRVLHKVDPRGPERVSRADEVETLRRPVMVATSEWTALDRESITFTASRAARGPASREVTMTGDQFAAFMGMWLSEGCTAKRPNDWRVIVSQNRDGRGYDEFRGLLTEILGSQPAYGGHSWTFSSKALYEYLQPLGKATTKHIPDEVLNLSARQLAIFWHYYWLGDGNWCRGQEVVSTVSKAMADDLQEVVQKLGWSAAVRTCKQTVTKQGLASIPVGSVSTVYKVSVRKTKTPECRQIDRVPYSGTVGCVTTANGIVYVRRNGQPVWSGNCYQQFVWGVPRIDLMDIINLGPDASIDDIKAINPMLDELTETVDEWSADQLFYLRMKTRTWTPYGFGPLEQGLLPAAIIFARQTWQWEFYRSGSLPQVFLDPGETIANAEEARQLQEAINMLGGDLGAKHQVIVLPPGSKVMPQKDTDLSDQLDEWLAALMCMPFGLTISDLGITPKIAALQSPSSSKAQAAQSADHSVRRSTIPRAKRLKKKLFDRVLQKLMGQKDMQWSWGIVEEGESRDDQVKNAMLMVGTGIPVSTIDEQRIALELDPLGLPWTTVPIIATATGQVIPFPTAQDLASDPTIGSGQPPTPPDAPGLPPKKPGSPPALGPGPKQPPGKPTQPAAKKPAAVDTAPASPAHAASESVVANPPKDQVAPKAFTDELSILRRYLKRGGKIGSFEPRSITKAAFAQAIRYGSSDPDVAIRVIKAATDKVNRRESALSAPRAAVVAGLGALAGQLSRGQIKPEAFTAGATGVMQDGYTAAYAAGASGAVSELGLDDDAAPDFTDKAADRAAAQSTYLDGFASDIVSGVSSDALAARAEMYAAGLTAPYEEGYVDTGSGDSDQANIVWNLGDDSAHCDNCEELDGQSFTADTLPGFPGDGGFDNDVLCEGGCLCNCSLSFESGGETLDQTDQPSGARENALGGKRFVTKADAIHAAAGWTLGTKMTTRAVKDGSEGGTQALRDWYNDGADGGIDWGSPGDFDACVAIAGDYIDNPEGYCQLRHIDATGGPAGSEGKDFSAGGPLASGFVPFDLSGGRRKKPRKKKDASSADTLAANINVVAAGLAVRAEDTGRVLMIQRMHDPTDPASGTFEFGGGHLEPGETPFHAACREWSEEVGCPVPDGQVVSMWESPNGIYQGFVLSVPRESDVNINLDRPETDNPDADLHAKPETSVWMDIDHIHGMPALRPELAADLPRVLPALRAPTRSTKAADAPQPRMVGASINESDVLDYLQEHYPNGDLGWVRRCLWVKDNVLLKDIDYQHRPGGIDKDKVAEMADELKDGKEPHPVVLVASPDDPKMSVADGYHRLNALAKNKQGAAESWVGTPKPGNDGWKADILAMQFSATNHGNKVFKMVLPPELAGAEVNDHLVDNTTNSTYLIKAISGAEVTLELV